VRPCASTRMFPSEVLVTRTVAGLPVLVCCGCVEAVEESLLLLPHAASASPASARIAPLARKVRVDLRDITIRSFRQEWSSGHPFRPRVVAIPHHLPIAAAPHP
jgi:hypothetical protein